MINSTPETLKTKEFTSGAVIVQAGSAAPKEMIVLVKGNVGVYKNYQTANEIFVKTISAGSFHCEQSLFLNKEQSDTLVALTDVVVLPVNRNTVKEFFVSRTDLAISIVENICGKLDAADTAMEKHQRENKKSAPSGKSKLFPDNHGSYNLPLANDNEQMVFCIKSTCPLCSHNFEILIVMMSRLKRAGTDPDMRARYKDVEPLYYEIVTCPNCLFSASRQSFDDAPKKIDNDINQKVGQYKLETPIQTGRDRDTFSVFAGYYLAALCAPVFLPDYQLHLGGIWNKISRLYSDCNDPEMEKFAAEKALTNYQYAYTNLRITEKQNQQICYVMGELNFKLEKFEDAKKYFYMVKTDSSSSEMMKRQADIRIDAVREATKDEETENNDESEDKKKKKKVFGFLHKQ